MVHVFAKLFYSEESFKGVLPVLTQLIEETRKEVGCIKYELCKVQGSNEEYAMVEVWESMDVLKLHMKSPHFNEAVPKMNAFSFKPLEVTILDRLV